VELEDNRNIGRSNYWKKLKVGKFDYETSIILEDGGSVLQAGSNKI
jgi:hypothetical protein